MIETRSYKIRTYSPEFLEQEIELTQEFEQRKGLHEVYQSYRSQAQIDQVKDYRENGLPNFPFNPTDHWYLFDNEDQMVGFIHAYPQPETKRCNVTFTVTKEGHEEGAELLFDTLVKSVKERGYDTLVRNTTEDQVVEKEFLNQFGFEQIKLRNLKAFTPIEELKIERTDLYQLEDYDADKHREEIITELYLPRGYGRDRLETQFDTMEVGRDNGTVPSWVVASQDGDLVGQSLAYYGKPDLEYIVQFNTVTTNLEGDESIPLISTIYGAHLENIPERITHIEHYLFGQVMHLRETYEKLGFRYLENHLYEKPI